jgi:hypothetical protein
VACLAGARDGDPVDQLDALARLAAARLEAVVLSWRPTCAASAPG